MYIFILFTLVVKKDEAETPPAPLAVIIAESESPMAEPNGMVTCAITVALAPAFRVTGAGAFTLQALPLTAKVKLFETLPVLAITRL